MTLAARLEALAVDFARDIALAFVRAPLSDLALVHRDAKPSNTISRGGGMSRAAPEPARVAVRRARRAPPPSPAPVAVEPSQRKPARKVRSKGAPTLPVLFGGRGRPVGWDEEE